MNCPSCGEQALPGDQFCENCGTQLTPVAVQGTPSDQGIPVPGEFLDRGEFLNRCRGCGGTDFADGYCSTCGAPAVRERDHWSEQPATWVAAVCDRGIRHHRNEDAVAVWSDGASPGSAGPAVADGTPGTVAALVVCDGVSSSADSDIASLAAARAARDVLAGRRPDNPSNAGRISAWTTLLGEAATAANRKATEAAAHPTGRTSNAGRSDGPPSCTFVVAVVDGPLIVAGGVGDSRAYWLPDGGPDGTRAQQLSRDDSWAGEAIEHGMARQQAENAPEAHSITRWLGRDSPDHQPRCTAVTVTTPGWLLLCSDGLWNYCSEAEGMADLVRETAAAVAHDPLKLSAALVDWANQQGGHDNITVAVARLDPQNPDPKPAREET